MIDRRTWQAWLALGAVAFLFALGSWQLQRMVWKRGVIAEREARLAAPPTALPREAIDPAAWEFRRVALEGRMRHDREIQLYGRRLQHGTPGYHILTPVETASGAILVDRGWVPIDRRAPASRAEGQVPGEIRVVGIARAPRPKAAFVPDNDPAKNQWFWVDLPAIAAATGLALREVLVEADATANPGGYPEGGQTRSELADNHLAYAFIWYSLSLACAVIYWLFRRRQTMDTE
jgi:surfeit locus 1 family protein